MKIRTAPLTPSPRRNETEARAGEPEDMPHGRLRPQLPTRVALASCYSSASRNMNCFSNSHNKVVDLDCAYLGRCSESALLCPLPASCSLTEAHLYRALYLARQIRQQAKVSRWDAASGDFEQCTRMPAASDNRKQASERMSPEYPQLDSRSTLNVNVRTRFVTSFVQMNTFFLGLARERLPFQIQCFLMPWF